MAVDKLVDSSQLNSDLTSVANAIRTKGGTSASLAFPSGFVSAIQAIPSGGTETTFVVTVAFSTTSDLWECDKTYSEIHTAYNAGKTIAVVASPAESVSADGAWNANGSYFDYWVRIYVDTSPAKIREQNYRLTSNGYVLQDDVFYITTPTGTVNITQAGNTDVTNYATASVPTASYYTGEEHEFYTDSNVRKWRYRGMTDLDVGEGDTEGWHGQGRQYGDYKVHNAVASGTTITPSTSSQTIGGANYMMEGAVTVNAMPTGTAGTPTASKGTVSNHQVSVTPSVTNTTGYITGSTKTGTAVTVTASELVSGSETKTANGTYNVTNLSELVVNVPQTTASKNVQIAVGAGSRVSTTGYSAIDGQTITVTKAGTYKVYAVGQRSSSSTGTNGLAIYKNGTAVGSPVTSGWVNNFISPTWTLTFAVDDVITLQGRSRSTSSYMYGANLTIIEQ